MRMPVSCMRLARTSCTTPSYVTAACERSAGNRTRAIQKRAVSHFRFVASGMRAPKVL